MTFPIVSEIEKLKSRIHVNKTLRAIDWWLEHKDIGVNLRQLCDEPDTFKGITGLKSARKRLKSEALKRYRTIMALRGVFPRANENPPWHNRNFDPRPIQGAKRQDGFFALGTLMDQTIFDVLTSAKPQPSTPIATAATSPNSKP